MQGVVALTLLGLAAWLISIHPFSSPAWVVGALCLGLLAAYRPDWGLFALLALLPVASLSIWSGWRVTDEFDVLLLLIVGGGYVHQVWCPEVRSPRCLGPNSKPMSPNGRPVAWLLRLAWAGVMVTGAVSAWRGWLDAGAARPDLLFGGDDSTGNVWRVAKSMVALMLAAPWLRALYRESPGRAIRSLQRGMLWGLILVCALAVWERAVYIGLWDLSSDYRITAWFWEMNVGGGAIDVYLALAFPFAWWALWRAKPVWQWLLAAALMVVLVYVVVTTYSRGVAGVFVGGSVLMWFWRRHTPQAVAERGTWHAPAQRWLVAGLLAEALLLVGAGQLASDRLSSSAADVQSRWAHWQSMHGLLKERSDWWWGIGQGRLPARHSAMVSGPALPGHVMALPASQAVRLYGTDTSEELSGRFALAQRVPLEPGSHVVRLTVRATQATQLRFRLCERHLLYDIRCQEAVGTVEAGPARIHEWALTGSNLAPEPGLARYREGMAMLTVMQVNRAVDVFSWDIREASSDRVWHRADFSDGFNGWYFVSTGYFRPWHADNLIMELWVERGLLGCVAFLALMASSFWILYRRWRQGEAWLLPVLGGLVSFMVLTCVISVTELPRLSFLVGIFLLISSLWGDVWDDASA